MRLIRRATNRPILRPARARQFGRWRDVTWWPSLDLLYVNIPKTAGTTIKTVLARATGCLDPDDLAAVASEPQQIHRRLRAQPGCVTQAGQITEAGLAIAVVRHPYDRFASFYRDKIVGAGWDSSTHDAVFSTYGFDDSESMQSCAARIARISDAESELHFRSQSAILAGSKQGLPCLIFRYESLSLLWLTLGLYCAERGVKLPRELPRLNASVTSTDALPDAASRELLRERYADDFSNFGYET